MYEMELDPDLWYVKVFFFMKALMYKFTERYRYRPSEEVTDICFVGRTILFGAMVILAHAILYGASAWMFTGLLVQLFDWSGLLAFWGWVLSGVVAFAVVVFSYKLLKAGLQQAKSLISSMISKSSSTNTELDAPENRPKFFFVFGECVRAVNEKFCFRVRFTKEGEHHE